MEGAGRRCHWRGPGAGRAEKQIGRSLGRIPVPLPHIGKRAHLAVVATVITADLLAHQIWSEATDGGEKIPAAPVMTGVEQVTDNLVQLRRPRGFPAPVSCGAPAPFSAHSRKLFSVACWRFALARMARV